MLILFEPTLSVRLMKTVHRIAGFGVGGTGDLRIISHGNRYALCLHLHVLGLARGGVVSHPSSAPDGASVTNTFWVTEDVDDSGTVKASTVSESVNTWF